MNFVIIQVGESKEGYFRDAFREYQKRLAPFGGLETIMIKPAPTGGGDLTAGEIDRALSKEGDEILRVLCRPPLDRYQKTALCVEGTLLSSEKLSEMIDKSALSGKSGMVFVIGSSWGLDPRVKKACDFRLSFSPMTFAHSLFRVMLAEQLYRAACILAGNKYHK